MNLFLYCKNRTLLGVLESFEYLRWTRRYSQCGSFELKAPATGENITLLQIGNYIWKNDDEEAAIIEFVELSMNGESEFITVSGRFATSFLTRRIVWNTEILSGDLAEGIGQLLNNHLIAPKNPDRQISGIAYNSPEIGISVSAQVSFKNLMTAVCDLCETVDVGIKTVFNPADRTFHITLYQGGEVQGIFSREYENLLDQVFTQSLMSYANVALVGGEGEGVDREFVTVGESANEERREIFIDAKDLRRENFPDDYTAALIFRGNSKLIESAMVQVLDAAINPYGNLTYKTDFDIGSKVQVISNKWGVSMTARITEIEESYDTDGMSLNVTFGKPLLTLAQKLKGGDT